LILVQADDDALHFTHVSAFAIVLFSLRALDHASKAAVAAG
jgi:hypothetical protein